MKTTTILLLVFGLTLPAFCDDLADVQESIDYRKKRLKELTEENAELKEEIAGYDELIGDSAEEIVEEEAGPLSYGDLLKKAARLEKQLAGKTGLLEKMKVRFIDRIPLKKGDALGTFTSNSGTTYESAVVSQTGPTGVTLLHSNGSAKLKANDFPDSISASWNKRPELPALPDLYDEIFEERPSSVFKSAAYAERRSEVAAERARLRDANRPVVETEASSAPVRRYRADREAEQKAKVAAIVEHNRLIESQIKQKEVKLVAVQSRKTDVEMQFMKDTMEYDIGRIRSGRGAMGKERERRHELVKTYEETKSVLYKEISDLESEIYKLASKRKYNPGASSDGLTLTQRKEKAAEVRAKAREMEDGLEEMFEEFYTLKDERTEALKEYESLKIKPDRKSYERRMNKIDEKIIRKMTEIGEREKEIIKVRNSIPRI